MGGGGCAEDDEVGIYRKIIIALPNLLKTIFWEAFPGRQAGGRRLREWINVFISADRRPGIGLSAVVEGW